MLMNLYFSNRLAQTTHKKKGKKTVNAHRGTLNIVTKIIST